MVTVCRIQVQQRVVDGEVVTVVDACEVIREAVFDEWDAVPCEVSEER